MKTLVNDWKEISQAFGWLSLLLSICTLGVVPFLLTLLEPYYTFGQMVLLTWPLTLSVAVLAFLWARDAFSDGLGSVMGVCFTIVFPYAVAAAYQLVPPLPDVGLEQLAPGRAVMLALHVVSYYFTSWGLARTIASVACGVFIAWVVDEKILKRSGAL